jgi:uncharacterized protein (TIGR02996 family)
MPGPRSELVSLLNAARQSPREDAPRLVLADWLEENGGPSDQARAELIRLQVKRSARSRFGKRHRPLSRPEAELISTYQQEWLGPLWSVSKDRKFTWVRGLVDFQVSLVDLMKRANKEALESEAAAWLDEAYLSDVTAPRLRKLLSSPVASWLGGLVIPSADLRAEECEVIANAQHLSRLHTLDLNYNPIGDEGARALASSRHLGNLHHLDLWICGIGPRGAADLAQASCLGEPDWLNLGGNHIGDLGARALAGSRILARARRLLLWGNDIGSEGAAELLRSIGPGVVEELYLNENGLSLPAARALAEWPGLRTLRSLSVWGNQLRQRGGEDLLSAPMPALRLLLISGNTIGDRGARALASNHSLTRLEQADLSGNGISSAGAQAVLDSECLPRLKNVNLSENRISQMVMSRVIARFNPTILDEVP